MQHEADCRHTYMLIAQGFQSGWPEYLSSTLELLHACDHMQATVSNEQALLVNTWNVITADGKIGYFEKKRILKVCKNLDTVMVNVSEKLGAIVLPEKIMKTARCQKMGRVLPSICSSLK